LSDRDLALRTAYLLDEQGRTLSRALAEFVEHDHERNHQGLGNTLIVPVAEQTNRDGRVASRARLGGLSKYYYRPAA
jgi:hypothetical protein